MKLMYKGGNIIKGQDPKTGKPTERNALEQLFEEHLYVWPEPGTSLSVPDNVGAWLTYKVGKFLQVVPEDPASRRTEAPFVSIAVREAPPAPPATKP